jgi:hypothetical protein
VSLIDIKQDRDKAMTIVYISELGLLEIKIEIEIRAAKV